MRLETAFALAATLLAAPLHSGPKEDARRALDECRALALTEEEARAIPRCEAAVALDFGLADAHFLLGHAHGVLAAPPRDGSASATLTPEQREAHRRKGMESYRRYLATGDPERDPAGRARALGELLGLYIGGDEKDEAILSYAEELVRQPSIPFVHLVYLAGVYSRHDKWVAAERFARMAVEANPMHQEACLMFAWSLGRPERPGGPGFEDMIATLERCARLAPRDPVGFFRLASMLWNEAYRNAALPAERKALYVTRGLAHADAALAIDPDYLEAVVYKGLLLRTRASMSSDPGEQQRLLDEATALTRRGAELRKAGVKLREDPYGQWFATAPPAPPPPPSGVVGGVTGGVSVAPPPPPPAPVRVGGAIREPRKLLDAYPVYPDIAKQARVQGVVILEVLIGTDGRVKDAKILRGIPLLDQAALDAVRQWVYSQTLLNGVPVPVLMTVTVNFRLT